MKNLFNPFLLKILGGILTLNIIIILIGLSIGYAQYSTIINYNISNDPLTDIKIAATIVMWYYILGLFFSIIFRNTHITSDSQIAAPFYAFGFFTIITVIMLIIIYINSFNV